MVDIDVRVNERMVRWYRRVVRKHTREVVKEIRGIGERQRAVEEVMRYWRERGWGSMSGHRMWHRWYGEADRFDTGE